MSRRRSRSNRYFFWFTLVVLCFVGFVLVFGLRKQASKVIEDFGQETEFKMYPGFAIPLPEDYSIHGIDVSRYQEQINWPLVKAMNIEGIRLRFAFIKATEGTTLQDRKFARNWQKSKKAGLVRGAYHFFRPGSSGASQARFFLKTAKLQPGDLPPVLDVEVAEGYSPEAIQQEVQAWLDIVEQACGVKPILYTNPSFYRNYLGAGFEDYPLWVAHYRQQGAPKVRRDWRFWQHNESGRVNGINAYVDFNVFNGDSLAFSQLLMP